jgi:hypothetical protein
MVHQSRWALLFVEINRQQNLVGGASRCTIRRAPCGSDAAIESGIAVTGMSVERSSALSFRIRTNASSMVRVLREISSCTRRPANRLPAT